RLDRGRTSEASTVDGTLTLTGHEELTAALDELGAEEDDGEVLVVRRITRDGRSRAQIGGVPVPIGTLSRLVGTAVTVHRQSDPQPGEDQALRTELERLGNAEELRAAASQAALALVGDEGPAAGALVDVAAELTGRAARTDPTLASLGERLDASRIELSDLAAELSRYADSIDGSPGRLDEANERLAELTSLVRDLGALLPGPEGPAGDVTELLEASRSAAIDLDRYDGADQEREESASELEQAEAEVEDLA